MNFSECLVMFWCRKLVKIKKKNSSALLPEDALISELTRNLYVRITSTQWPNSFIIYRVVRYFRPHYGMEYI